MSVALENWCRTVLFLEGGRVERNLSDGIWPDNLPEDRNPGEVFKGYLNGSKRSTTATIEYLINNDHVEILSVHANGIEDYIAVVRKLLTKCVGYFRFCDIDLFTTLHRDLMLLSMAIVGAPHYYYHRQDEHKITVVDWSPEYIKESPDESVIDKISDVIGILGLNGGQRYTLTKHNGSIYSGTYIWDYDIYIGSQLISRIYRQDIPTGTFTLELESEIIKEFSDGSTFRTNVAVSRPTKMVAIAIALRQILNRYSYLDRNTMLIRDHDPTKSELLYVFSTAAKLMIISDFEIVGSVVNFKK
jgi:hypothetical protein